MYVSSFGLKAAPIQLPSFKGGVTASVLTTPSKTEDDEVIFCLKTTHSQAGYSTCLADLLTTPYNNNTQRIAFAKHFGALVRSYREYNGIFVLEGDIFRPPTHHIRAIISQDGTGFDVDDKTILNLPLLNANAQYQMLKITYPAIKLGTHLDTPIEHGNTSEGGQVFYIHYPLTNLCRTNCPSLGTVTMGFTFDRSGQYTGASITNIQPNV